MIKLKVTENQGFTISLADTFLKNHRRGQIVPPVFLGLRIFP